MPTYDYRCRDCGTTIELIHGMTEDGPAVCDVCGGPMRRVLFPTGIIFKGSGFYRTDSRSSSASSSPSTSSASSSTGSTDAAPASGTGGTDAPSAPKTKPKPAAASD